MASQSGGTGVRINPQVQVCTHALASLGRFLRRTVGLTGVVLLCREMVDTGGHGVEALNPDLL
jgi:hypothetical protein